MSTAPVKVWTVRELLAWSRGWFEERGVDSPRLTAEMLLSHVLGCARIKLYVDIDRPLEKGELADYKALVQRRAKGEPVQYVIGSQDFYGRTFGADKRALIPRPETELVAERLLRHFPEKQATLRLADIGCGTGALGLTLAAERRNARVVLTDVSAEAASLARENAEKLGILERVEIRLGDLATPLAGETFDGIVSNLPYVPDGERDGLAPHIRDHEPHLALFGGPDGLDLYRRLVPGLSALVRPGGIAVIEHGSEHGESAPALFPQTAWELVTVERDLAGLHRFTWAVRRQS